MPRLVTPLIAALTLVVGFAIAQATGSQLLGGITLLVGAGWCVLREVRRTPWWRIAVVVAVAVLAFALSHRLGDLVGPWPAVLLAAALTGGAAALLLTTPAPTDPAPPEPGTPVARP